MDKQTKDTIIRLPEIHTVNATLSLLVQIAGVVVVLLNIWIVTKLAPVAQDLAVIVSRVDALEERNNTDLANINSRLNSIEQTQTQILLELR